MTRKRFDIVREGATWTVGLGGPSSRGHLSRAAAIHAAEEAAAGARAAGDSVEIYIWDGAEPTELITPTRHAAE
jgi:hypothetical protein